MMMIIINYLYMHYYILHLMLSSVDSDFKSIIWMDTVAAVATALLLLLLLLMMMMTTMP